MKPKCRDYEIEACRRNDEGKDEETPKADMKTLHSGRLMPQIEQMVIENSLN